MASALSGNTLGIDFGTSNSAAGVCVEGKPFLIPIEEGETTLPTAVFFGLDAREITLGRPAGRALIAGDEGRYMRALKSVLGTSLMGERRSFLGKPMTFYDIIAHFLKQVKTRAESACFTTFDHALSGRPVQFHSRDKERDAQAQKDLTECYTRAGFKSVRFMLEPEAAALATQSMAQDGLCLIVDIGGGTSDFSVFEAKGDGIQVRASQGIRLGGTDFDKILSVQHVMPLLGRGAEIRKEMGAGVLPTPNSLFQKLATWEQIPFMYAQDVKRDVARMHRLAVRPELLGRLADVLDLELGHEIAFAVETGKIRANSGEEDAKIQLNMIEKTLEAALTPEQLFQSLEEEVTQIRQGALDTIERAHCTPEDISKVIFVGGSSLLGPVQKILEATCPQAEMAQADAFTAVIDGLALASADPHRYGAASD